MHAMYLKELDANLIVVLDALLIDASVSRAAERLGRSPSAVSHALSNLREIFSDQLFVRAGQRLVPTARALSLAPAVHVIVSGMESLLRPQTPFNPVTLERSFVLACSETREITMLNALQHRLAEIAPAIQLSWQSPRNASFVEDLRSGAIHFLIHEGELEGEAADICLAHLCNDSYVTLVRSGHKLTKGRPKESAYRDYQHIMVAPTSWRPDPVRQHLERHGISIHRGREVSSVLSGLFLAAHSDDLITVPKAIEPAGVKLGLVPVPAPFPALEVPVQLCWHRSHDRDECHQWMGAQIMGWYGVATNLAELEKAAAEG